ncbi:MAG TPA: methyltransferase domain-containing protein [Terriglobia bacterium]|nr:methyltransferase domain-containing protein [Terriglobia bacterium]
MIRLNYRVTRITCLLSSGLLCFCLSLEGAQLGKRPAKEYIPILENPGRVERLKPDQVVALLNLKHGDVVADVGSGSGVFTRRFAQAVGPEGKVYAVDIDKELLDYNRERIEEAKLNNVEFILGEYDDPKLPSQAVDLAFICDVLHHIEHRQVYLAHLHSCLKDNGRLAIIDYKTNWPPGHEPMAFSIQDLLTWTRNAGFQKSGEFDLISDAFFMIFVLGN